MKHPTRIHFILESGVFAPLVNFQFLFNYYEKMTSYARMMNLKKSISRRRVQSLRLPHSGMGRAKPCEGIWGGDMIAVGL